MYEVAKLMHIAQAYSKKLSTNLSSFFSPITAIHTRTTRLALSDYNLYLPRCKTQNHDVKHRNFKTASDTRDSRSGTRYPKI